MKTIHLKKILCFCGALASISLSAQSSDTSPVTFKQLQSKYTTDHFIAREIKKKELQIAPSSVVLINNVSNSSTRQTLPRKKKKIRH